MRTKQTMRGNWRFAHVDDPRLRPLRFHLNINPMERIPRIGDKVIATPDNGRQRAFVTITRILGWTRFPAHRNPEWPHDVRPPFVSVEYEAQ